MKSNFILFLIELIAFIVAALFGVLWFLNPDGGFYEPVLAMCGLVGTVLVGMIRRKVDGGKAGSRGAIIRVDAEARYVVEDKQATPEGVWSVLTRPFLERYQSWHPSYGDFEPVSQHGGKPDEFEAVGSSGGRYPWRIEEWNDSAKVLRLWVGPSKNPPSGHREIFLGLDLEFKVISGLGVLLIEIVYRERWSNQPWPTEEETFRNGPEREIHWIFGRFPFRGRLDYVRALDEHRHERRKFAAATAL